MPPCLPFGLLIVWGDRVVVSRYIKGFSDTPKEYILVLPSVQLELFDGRGCKMQEDVFPLYIKTRKRLKEIGAVRS
jgi:hypothetical protein